MVKKRGLWIILLISIVLVAFFAQREISKDAYKTKILGAVEINDYEGEKLSSINDFRENSIKGPQYIDKKDYLLKITGLVENPKDYTYEEVKNLQNYKKIVTLNCVEGWSVKILWEGFLVKEIIEKAIPLQNATTIIFYAYDGYTTSFPINYILNNEIIMAHAMNNVTLTPERGFPFQLVAESKWGYKWIKWITEIELSDDSEYEGYWESRGYSNKGNLNESFLK